MTVYTEADIRVVRDSIGEDGRAVADRVWKVWIGPTPLKDRAGRVRRFATEGGARKAARIQIYLTEQKLP